MRLRTVRELARGAEEYQASIMREVRSMMKAPSLPTSLEFAPISVWFLMSARYLAGSHRSHKAQCIVWGIGTVVCEPGKQVTSEERGLLRFLGRGFINRSSIDGRGHWNYGVSSKDQSENSDYTLVRDKGDPLQVRFQRVTKAPGPMGFDATTNGTVLYSETLTVPMRIDEDTMLRTQMIDGDYIPGGYEQVRTTMDFRLTDDSLSAAARTP